MGDGTDAACGVGVVCAAKEGEGGGADAVPSPSFSMIEPNSPIGILSVRGKDAEALVDERPKCFTGGRSSIGAAQCAGSELGEIPVMKAVSYMTE